MTMSLAALKFATSAHTRRGSFVIPLQMPMPESDQYVKENSEPTFEGLEVEVTPEPPQRRVMRTFAESLAAINAVAVEPEREPSRDGIYDLIRAGVSHQFASALQRVLAADVEQ
jgi:hypothetical protein